MTDQELNQSVIGTLRAFLTEERGLAPDSYDQSSALFTNNFIASPELIDMILLIETEFGISIPTADVTIERFDSLNLIADYVAEKRAK